MPELKRLQDEFQEIEAQALQDFFTFLRFRSISTLESHAEELNRCKDWLKNYLLELGLTVEEWPTERHPTLFAHDLSAGPTKPTVLLYNHYDVQPSDPDELWDSPPFEPVLKDGQIYARGAQDNKGQCFYVLQALKMLRKKGPLPVNVKLVIEGEEEIGSPGLTELVKSKQDALKADFLGIVDLGIPSMERPAVTLGVRGITAWTIQAKGPNADLHSGSHGGLILNPIHALTRVLDSLWDQDGRVAVPGFYDDYDPLSDEQLSRINMAFDAGEYQEMFGQPPRGGEKTLPPLERNWLRPALEINGIGGGYQGKGFKTVIPAEAVAKLSCRLGSGQDPDRIANLVKAFIEEKSPEGVDISATIHAGGGAAVLASPDSEVVTTFAKAYSDVFGMPCEFILEGGSIPIIPELAKASTAEVALLGLGLASDAIHSPNEHFGWDRIKKGSMIIARALERFGE